jgi:hypothetical protein
LRSYLLGCVARLQHTFLGVILQEVKGSTGVQEALIVGAVQEGDEKFLRVLLPIAAELSEVLGDGSLECAEIER